MAGSRSLRLLAAQPMIPETSGLEERDRHLASLREKLDGVLDGGAADLVVLPELTSIDYGRQSFDRLEDLAEPLEGPSFATWSRLARDRGVHVAYGFPRRAADGFRISQAVVGPDGGLLGHYDKIHLAQYGASMEKDYFRRGDGLFLFEVKGFRLAPIICYDIRIPELARSLVVDHGADAILHCGAYYRDVSFYSWHAFAVTRALENQAYLLSLNRAGSDYGHSLFCPPWIDETSPATVFSEHDEDFRLLTLDGVTIERARREFSFLVDRLDSYDLPTATVLDSHTTHLT